MVHASTTVCMASNVRRRGYKGSRCGTRFHPSVQGVPHEVCAWAENYGFIQKIVALHLRSQWKKFHTHLRGAAQRVHASMDSGMHWLVMMFGTPCIGTTVICRRTPGNTLPDHCGWPCCLREG